MTVSTKMIKLILSRTELPYVQIQHGKRLQVVPDMASLKFCQKNQSASFVAKEQVLVVWEDDPGSLLERAQGIQDSLVRMIWGNELSRVTDAGIAKTLGIDIYDLDAGFQEFESPEEPRPIRLWQTVYTAMAITMLTAAIGSGWRQVAIQQVYNPNWFRMLFALTLPAQGWLALVSSSTTGSLSGPLTRPSFSSKPSSATSHNAVGRSIR
jgi:hypothetical protein